MISPRLGADTSSPTDMTDDASDSVGDMSITSKDSGELRVIIMIMSDMCSMC